MEAYNTESSKMMASLHLRTTMYNYRAASARFSSPRKLNVLSKLNDAAIVNLITYLITVSSLSNEAQGTITSKLFEANSIVSVSKKRR